MPFCTNCGAEIQAGSKFCVYCGQAQSGGSDVPAGTVSGAPADGYSAYSAPADPYAQGAPAQGSAYGGSDYSYGGAPGYNPDYTRNATSAVEPVNTTGLMIWSVVTFLLSLIPGLIAVSLTRKINKCDTVEQQQKTIRNVKIWCIIGDVLGVIVLLIRMSGNA